MSTPTWKPATSLIPSLPSDANTVVNGMCFSADVTYLAISCDNGVQVWDLLDNAPRYLGQSSKASGKALCVTSFKTTSGFVSGHDDGAICVILVNRTHEEPIRTKLMEGFRCEAVISMTLFEDQLLAAITSSSVRVYEVGLLASVRLVGTAPFPCAKFNKSLTMDPTPRAIHWLVSQQLAVTYSDVIVIWGVEVGGKHPARFKMVDDVAVIGSVYERFIKVFV
ncbi:hypothetical protein VKT23_015910 [Stygiomarasmius scandens]|uniref:Uncharacterized protein n=1 Tax=Marasmiellus scandens TaxID=2682957 RepID=A0ABR1IWJ4_9AGAR